MEIAAYLLVRAKECRAAGYPSAPRGGFLLGVSVCQPHSAITETVERLAAGERQHGALALVDLCEGVEEAPQVPGAELSVGWLAPLLHDLRHLARCDRPAVDRADDEVVCSPVLL